MTAALDCVAGHLWDWVDEADRRGVMRGRHVLALRLVALLDRIIARLA